MPPSHCEEKPQLEEKRISNAEKKPRINEEIRVPEVRLIDADGNQLGVVSTHEARRISEESGQDLVEVSPDSLPSYLAYGSMRSTACISDSPILPVARK